MRYIEIYKYTIYTFYKMTSLIYFDFSIREREIDL